MIPRALTVPRPLPVNEDAAEDLPGDALGDGAGDGVDRTARFRTPPVPPRRRPARPPRAVLAVIAAVLLVFGVGAGIWYINSGQFTKVPPLLSQTEAQARRGWRRPGSTSARSSARTATPWSAAR